MTALPLAIQCYSVRDHLERDPESTLRRLKEIGYDHVELFDIRPDSAARNREWLEGVGLGLVAAHLDFDLVTGSTDEAVAAARTLGAPRVVIPWVDRDSAAGWIAAAEAMAAAGARFREAGIPLGYHHHEHEFVTYDGRTAFDLIFETAPSDHLFVEIDTYWAVEGGANPVTMLERFGARCPLLHVKDRAAPGGSCRFAEIGAGVTEWDPIFRAARASGVQWFIVEQDDSAGDSLESAARSARFMKQWRQG